MMGSTIALMIISVYAGIRQGIQHIEHVKPTH